MSCVICLHWARSCTAALTCLCLTVHTAIEIVWVPIPTSALLLLVLHAGDETHGFGMLGKCSATEPWAQPLLPSLSCLCTEGRELLSVWQSNGPLEGLPERDSGACSMCPGWSSAISHLPQGTTVLGQRLIFDLRKKMLIWG